MLQLMFSYDRFNVKKSVIMNTVVTAILLSHPRYHKFIFDAINERVKKLFINQVDKTREDNNSEDINKTFMKNSKNVVYKVPCKDCDATYVGQTKRKLNTRINKHKSQLRKNNGIDWENVKVIDRERYLGNRLVSEMIHIKLQMNELNLQTDTEFFHHRYTSILDQFNN
ncbi:hypothetical protein ALC53_09147 [Atta colombica]|uniref:GIY-YIG domain-containing protein n=1 Tax=Atta colombica TaxID=520822 RepID=A0A151I1S2_9HYME|nr:hypothetical protein ALC53_09147 [Atta colombica]